MTKRSMFELPLFPLNTVLFPGMPIELHIFEERYKQMIGMCIDKSQPFGVVLIRRGRAEHGLLAQPYTVGCTARITQVQPLGQGRMNIMAIGQERFQILSLNRDKPYLVGMVELYPLGNTASSYLTAASQHLRYLVERFLRIMDQAGQIRFRTQQIPQDPISLAYLASVLLQIPPVQQKALLATLISSSSALDMRSPNFRSFVAQQQSLLESEQASTLFSDLCRIYRREVAVLDSMLKGSGKNEEDRPFSAN